MRTSASGQILENGKEAPSALRRGMKRRMTVVAAAAVLGTGAMWSAGSAGAERADADADADVSLEVADATVATDVAGGANGADTGVSVDAAGAHVVSDVAGSMNGATSSVGIDAAGTNVSTEVASTPEGVDLPLDTVCGLLGGLPVDDLPIALPGLPLGLPVALPALPDLAELCEDPTGSLPIDALPIGAVCGLLGTLPLGDLPVALPTLPVVLPNLPVALPELPTLGELCTDPVGSLPIDALPIETVCGLIGSLPADDLPVDLPELPVDVPELPVDVPLGALCELPTGDVLS